MGTTNLTPSFIKSIDSELMSLEEIFVKRQKHILTSLPKYFEIFEEGDGSTLVHCLKADMKEVLGDLWYLIIREFIIYGYDIFGCSNRGYSNCIYSNLIDEEAELVFFHNLNQYLADGITGDHGAWGYWVITTIEVALASNAVC